MITHLGLAAGLLIATASWLFSAIQLGRLGSLLKRGLDLRESPSELPPGREWPKVSIIVPACNEEKAIETAIRSLLAQEYPNLEVVAIDDRSTDSTGAIMDRIKDERLTVLHIKELPAGWLGKNNANHQGALRSSGQWVLFTDGDVKFAPDLLRRAIAFATRYSLGHLVALPLFITRGFWECSFVSIFSFFYSTKLRLWELMQPGTRAYMGSGTFNLVRRDDYERIGGHTTLRMEVADDMKLGLVLRRSGVRQGLVDSGGAVAVRWQEGFAATVKGIVKNAFAGLDWQWGETIATVFGITLISVLPFAVLVCGPADLRLLALAPAGLACALQGLTARRFSGGKGFEGLAHPLMACTFIGVLLWSAWSATTRDGISWRGTRYQLKDLKAGCIRDSAYPVANVIGWTL